MPSPAAGFAVICGRNAIGFGTTREDAIEDARKSQGAYVSLLEVVPASAEALRQRDFEPRCHYLDNDGVYRHISERED